jgi:glycine/serine hydroxymethyltransferase
MPIIANLIARTLRHREDAAAVAGIRKEVADLCSRFPAYPNGL